MLIEPLTVDGMVCEDRAKRGRIGQSEGGSLIHQRQAIASQRQVVEKPAID